MATITIWTTEFIQKNGKIIEGIGAILHGIGEVVPSVGGPLRVLGVFASFCGSKASQQAEERKKLVGVLENFLSDLEKTFVTLSKYDDDDRKNSRLTLEVKISLTSCITWTEMIEKKKEPRELLETINKRVASLQMAISQEVLEQAIRVNQKAKLILAIQKLDKKKPWEYYEDAKYLISQKRWLEAKANLQHYRNYVEAKTPVMDEKNDNGVKPPSQDNHLKYLAYVQDQLAAQTKENPDPILSVVPTKTINQYQKDWENWQATYMKRT
jgi:hypothetical protein